jgi:hypothetical protein
MESAIPNLEFIRQLIAEARRDVPGMDMERLRMVMAEGSPMVTEQQEDR